MQRESAEIKYANPCAWYSGMGRWAAILLLCGLFVLLRWSNYKAPLWRDEGEYAYSAQLLINGLAPYQHSFIQKPPLVIYTYALSDLIAPQVYFGPRLLADLFVALATLLLGYIARVEFGSGVALPAMFLATPMVLLPEIEQFTANTETFMLLPLLGMVAVYVRGRKESHGAKFLWAGGALGAVTFFYKYTALPLVGFICVCWLFEIWRLKDRALLWRSLGWLAAGAALATAASLGWFLWRDGGARLWECTIEFNRYYAGSANFGLTNLWPRLGGFWRDWWCLFLLAPAALLVPGRRVWFWVGMLVMAGVSTNNSAYGQYYVLVMPFWALLSAVGIRVLAARANERLGWPAQWLGGAVLAVVLVLVLWPDKPWMFCSPQRFSVAKMTGFPFLEAQLVAQKVAEMSSGNDLVYVAGSEPEILYYARRFSPTRFITTYALMIPTPVAERYQMEAMVDLAKNPPALIVLVKTGNSWLRQETSPAEFQTFLDSFLSQNYERVGGYVPDEKNGGWFEPLAQNQMPDASLVLFRHRK